MKLGKFRSKGLFFGGLFFLIFAFPITSSLSSAKIVMLFVLISILVSQNFSRITKKTTYAFVGFFKLYYNVFLYTFAITVLWGAFEFSLVNKIVSSFFLYIISFFFLSEANHYIDIKKGIIYCFLIQSIFIILAIFSESFYSFTAPFRGEMSELHELAYGRLRGNAICGYQFFGIASMFTFVIIYLILHLKEFKYPIVLLIPICIASICSGRFAITGIIIGIGMLFIRAVINKQIGKVLWASIAGLGLLVGIVALLYYNVGNISDPIMQNVVQHYLIDPIDSILLEKSFHSSSTDVLLEMYDKEDIKQYFLLGSGRYTNPDGHYFGGVDIGYYRMLGYYGILGFCLITYALYYLIYRTKANLDIYTKHAFFLNFLILNLKGDVQIYSNNIIPIVITFLFFSSKSNLTSKECSL